MSKQGITGQILAPLHISTDLPYREEEEDDLDVQGEPLPEGVSFGFTGFAGVTEAK